MLLIFDDIHRALLNKLYSKPHGLRLLCSMLIACCLSTASLAQSDSDSSSSHESSSHVSSGNVSSSHSAATHKSPHQGQQTNTIYIANGEWPPYLSEKLENYGPISQLVTEAFAISGINVQYSFMPWKRGYEESSRDLMDGTLLWSRSPEREKLFLYSDPIMNLRYVLFHRSDEHFDWQTREDLYGKLIGGAIGYHYTLEAEHEQNLLSLERIRKPENNYFKLLSGRLDLVIENDAVGFETIKQLNLFDQIQAHPKPVKDMAYHLILGKNNKYGEYFLEKFNHGLAELKNSGRYDQLMDAVAKARVSIHPSLQHNGANGK